jgi:hypothetical protein
MSVGTIGASHRFTGTRSGETVHSPQGSPSIGQAESSPAHCPYRARPLLSNRTIFMACSMCDAAGIRKRMNRLRRVRDDRSRESHAKRFDGCMSARPTHNTRLEPERNRWTH